MATTIARLQAVLSANTADFERGMARSETRMHKVSRTAAIAGAAIVGGIAFGLERSVKAALHAQTSQVRLDRAFKNSGLSAGRYSKAVVAAESASRKLGFTDEETKTSLGSLITATKDYGKAAATMSTAQDIARFKGVGLVDATKMLTMAMTGSQRAAKQLGITVQPLTTNFDALSKNADKAEKAHAKFLDKLATGDAVVKAVNERLHGQAAAYADTASGGMAQFRAQLDHLEVSLGTALLPALVKVSQELSNMLEFLGRHTTATKILIGVIGGLGVAMISLSVAEKAYRTATIAATASQWALNVAMDANTVGALTAAIVGLTAALVVLQVKYQGVTRAVSFLRREWELLLIPVSSWLALALFVAKRLGLIQGAVTATNAGIHAMVRALEKVVDAFKWIIDNVKKIGGALGAVGGFFGGVAGAVGGAAGKIGDAKAGIMGAGSGAREGRQFDVERSLWPVIGLGERDGLRVTSGYRPGAMTKHGTKSDHSYNPSHAVDMAGAAGSMARFFRQLIGHREIKQAFYDPLGSIFNGVLSSYREGGHSDHVHVAEYDRGGFLKPGWNLALNNTGRPEPVGGNITIPVSIGGEHIATVVFDMLRRKAAVYEKRNARPAW